MESSAARLRNQLYVQLEPTAWPRRGLSPSNKGICCLILFSAAIAILQTEPGIFAGYESQLLGMEWLFAALFAVEYAGRVWVAVENPHYGAGLLGRWRYVRSPVAVFDLVVLISIFLSLGGSEAFLLRAFRMVRIFSLARLGRFSLAMRHISEAVRSRRYELVLSVAVAAVLLVASSTLLYLVEGDVQPQAFGSIPRAMWWAIITLTTVGYGDVFPATPLGRIIAAVTAMTGIGLIAMPTGILAAAFSEIMQRHRRDAE